MFSVCIVLYVTAYVICVCMRVSIYDSLCIANDLFRPWPAIIGCLLIINKINFVN